MQYEPCDTERQKWSNRRSKKGRYQLLKADTNIMQIEQSVIDAIVATPGEGLNVELKRWIDPTSNAGIEKIAKATLALRNRNGGYLVIGFDDSTLQPDAGHEPANIRDAFHVDVIQAIVSRYASELFEIGVGFSRRDGIDHPVISIPAGIRTPVAAKRNLLDGGRALIRNGAVYFRTLAANGTASTAEARPEDWRDIVEICFDNREADVGRFLRRQLGGDVATIAAVLREIGFAANSSPPPTLGQTAYALLDDGESHFQTALESRTLNPEAQRLSAAAAWSVALVIDPSKMEARPDRAFASTIASSNPKLTGWPVWLDASSSGEPENRSKVRDNALEALIIFLGSSGSNHLDFYRLDPRGRFYLRRVLQDDAVPARVAPGTALDPFLVVLRVAEAIAVGISFAKALGWTPETTKLAFAFRWQKLAGRALSQWSDPYGGLDWGTAHDDEVTTFVQLSLDTPLAAIAPYVREATQDLFVLFDGHVLTPGSIEEWVQRLIERRLR
jgi:hypothetical protein